MNPAPPVTKYFIYIPLFPADLRGYKAQINADAILQFIGIADYVFIYPGWVEVYQIPQLDVQ